MNESYYPLRTFTPEVAPPIVLCATCLAPATCMGAYECAVVFEPACDGCCGHGNEDGSCMPVFEYLAYQGHADFLASIAPDCRCCSSCNDVPCGGCQQGAPCDAFECTCDGDWDGSADYDDGERP